MRLETDTETLDEGFDARARDEPLDSNPYAEESAKWRIWRRGWFNADDALKDLGENDDDE